MHNFNINIRILCMVDRIETAVVCCVMIKYYRVALLLLAPCCVQTLSNLYIQLLVFCSSRAGKCVNIR